MPAIQIRAIFHCFQLLLLLSHPILHHICWFTTTVSHITASPQHHYGTIVAVDAAVVLRVNKTKNVPKAAGGYLNFPSPRPVSSIITITISSPFSGLIMLVLVMIVGQGRRVTSVVPSGAAGGWRGAGVAASVG